ncbi:hypothetical protein KFL_000670100 [Klebsormidium nitens]|uniref:Uncharacterized protein n=1 Tax=Klebsormidium nitens TaxID=105231 RepID=A0A1Y1HT03_KLENI|nr:hypothetical protein KFL_000670100 [Klebsormidium nitens]|eukprot:GAQ80952.1 hypothetical protein KFL_000670100 [Klebsormidium nitens]
MLEYDAGVGFPLDNQNVAMLQQSMIEGSIGPEVPLRICELHMTEDLEDFLYIELGEPEWVGRVSLTPWTAVVKSLSNFPEAAFAEDPVTGHDLPVLHLLEYTYVSDVLEKRGPYREAHLKLAAERCIIGGPKGDPIDGALLLFGTNDKSVVEDFVSQDPYVAGGLVTSHRIRPWQIDCCNLDYFKKLFAKTITQEQSTEVDLIEVRSRISSMSGFSKVDGKHKQRCWSWEVKSVNGRSLDVRARVPSGYSSLEQAALAAAAERFARGSVSCFLDIKMDKEQQDRRLVIDEDAMLQALEAMNRLFQREARQLPGGFNYGHLLQIPGVVRWEEPEESEEEKEDFVQKLTESLHDALDQLLDSRAAEGDRLRAVLSGQVAELEALVEQAAVTAQERLPHLKDRMQKQVGELLETFRALDPGRLEQEVALLTTRLDVREEVDRLRSHIVAAKELLSGHHKQATSPKKGKDEEGSDRPLSIGRQLDFLCQEFTRECATICSKSNDVPLTQIAMQMRGVSEQIKEQAANVQ